MKTRDIDIRRFLQKKLTREFQNDPGTVIIDELGLCQGEARVDVAVVNGFMHGYEIKSESDTLERLPNQINIYNKILDTVTVITGECHIEKLLSLIPDWWGVQQVEHDSDKIISLTDIRKPNYNPRIDAYALVQLLWRDEALQLLKTFGLEKGYLSKPRKILWKRLTEKVPLSELQFHIRETLKHRKNWRAD